MLQQLSNRLVSPSSALNNLIHVKVGFKVKGVRKMLTIGPVARQVGIRPSTLRYYEAQGILRPAARGANGYRVYSDDAIKLLLFVRRAQSLGITLKEMKGLLSLATQGQRPCERVKELAKSHLKEINQKIRELQTLQNDLRMLLRRKAGRPKADEVCPLVERGAANIR